MVVHTYRAIPNYHAKSEFQRHLSEIQSLHNQQSEELSEHISEDELLHTEKQHSSKNTATEHALIQYRRFNIEQKEHDYEASYKELRIKRLTAEAILTYQSNQVKPENAYY